MMRLQSKITAAQAQAAFTSNTFKPQSGNLDVTVSHGYNDRSEVTAGNKYAGTDITDKTSPVTTYDYGYGYDPIGNRAGSVVGADPAPITTAYTANPLNQYSAWSSGGGTPLTPQYEDDGNMLNMPRPPNSNTPRPRNGLQVPSQVQGRSGSRS